MLNNLQPGVGHQRRIQPSVRRGKGNHQPVGIGNKDWCFESKQDFICNLPLKGDAPCAAAHFSSNRIAVRRIGSVFEPQHKRQFGLYLFQRRAALKDQPGFPSGGIDVNHLICPGQKLIEVDNGVIRLGAERYRKQTYPENDSKMSHGYRRIA